MKKYLQCVLAIALMAISLNAASQSGAPAVANWTKSAGQNGSVIYTYEQCSVTILKNGDYVLYAKNKENGIKEIVIGSGGEVRKLWLSTFAVIDFGPNYLGDCPFERLPFEIRKKISVPTPLLAKR